MLIKNFIIGYKFFFAALVFAAILSQFALSFTTNPSFNSVNFFSFFTIESNILAATIFLASGFLQLKGKNSTSLTLWRGAAALYMTITGLVYVTLLSGLEDSLNTPTPWVNITLHYIFPAVAFLDWFVDRPAQHVSFKKSLVWLIFPLCYLAYSLIRGAFVQWYPYPFLNPTINGYGQVFVVSLSIAIITLGMCSIFAATSGKGQMKTEVKQRRTRKGNIAS